MVFLGFLICKIQSLASFMLFMGPPPPTLEIKTIETENSFKHATYKKGLKLFALVRLILLYKAYYRNYKSVAAFPI